jgi:hypothetical protein
MSKLSLLWIFPFSIWWSNGMVEIPMDKRKRGMFSQR